MLNFDQINLAELLRQEKDFPSQNIEHYGYTRCSDHTENIRRINRATERRMAAERDTWLSSPVLGQRAIVGYLLGEVGRARSTLETGQVMEEVFTMHTDALAEIAEEEGAQVVKTHEEGTLSGATHIVLGKYVITHINTLHVYYGDDIDVRGGQGPLYVTEFESPDQAVSAVEAVAASQENAKEVVRVLTTA